MVDHNNEDDWKELVTDVDGFWNEETSPEVQGRVVSITQMDLARRETTVAILTLTKPCVAVTGSKAEKKDVKLAVGQAIGVVLKHKLQDLPSMVDNQCEVNIKAKEKVSLDNGNSLWRYAIRFRGRRTGFATASASNQARKSSSSPSSENEDDSIENF